MILNPHAGSAEQVTGLLQGLGRLNDPVVRLTQRHGHAEVLAREAVQRGDQLIIAAGGDGTVNQVINGIAPHFEGVTLGVIPLGTGNDFGRSIGLMPGEVAPAIDAVLAQHTRPIDVVRVVQPRERYFINHAAGGFSTVAGQALAQERKNAWGPLAYLRSAVAALPEACEYRTRITLDSGEVLDLDLYNIVVSNGRFIGGGIPVAPEARLDDGLLDVMIVPCESFGRIAVLVSQMLVGAHLDNPGIILRRAASLLVEPRAPMAFALDGELVDDNATMFQVVPQALRVIGPARPA